MSAQIRQRGFIIVAALWILGALSALVLIYLNFVAAGAMLVAGNGDRPQFEALAGAGIELAAFRILADGGAPRGRFEARVGPHRIAVSFVSESARIDLNAAPKRLLAALFVALGASADAAQSYADRIAAWRTPADPEGDPESVFYRASGADYAPRHAPFPLADEVWLVRGIPEHLVARALPHLTTFSNQPSVDAAIASRFVVAAAGEGAAQAPARAYRVTVTALLGNGARSAVEAVILLIDNAPVPYRVLAWRDAFDGATFAQEVAAR